MSRKGAQPWGGNCNTELLRCSCEYGEVVSVCRGDDFCWKPSVYTFFTVHLWTGSCSCTFIKLSLSRNWERNSGRNIWNIRDMAVGFIALLTLAWTFSVGAASQNETAGADFSNTPYNVTWYDQRTGLEFTGEENHIVLHGASLLFLNISMEHQGHYLCFVRTPEQCYKQVRVVVVEEARFGTCRRPQVAVQRLQNRVSDNLRCPLTDYISIVNSYSIRWYKGCELLQEGSKFNFAENNLFLHIHSISPNDTGIYTCRMTFNLTGVISVVAESIECEVFESRSKRPQMLAPTYESMKVSVGSPINKTCHVFVPGKGVYMPIVIWDFNGNDISLNTSERIHQGPQNDLQVAEGLWVERSLLVSQVLPGDLNLNFTCTAMTHRGVATGYFTVQPADPNLLMPIGLLATTLALLFIMGLLLYRVFKVELALLFRTLFPFFYTSTDGDGKLYDAYVVYPRVQGDTLSEAVEAFAVKTLPQVLEGCYGYRLFILGRDSLPGQAMVDMVEETMNVCRRMLLLYTSLSLSRAEGSSWFEQQAGLRRALLDDSLSVLLLEMEQLSDPSILPESLRLLRDKQGALQAWKKRKRWTCTRMEEGGEDEISLPSFTLSARFWRKVRYHMPVRGKVKHHLKRKLLLNL
ncbi:interleukin-1 receptor type 1-like isoform X2 [Neoarius graeffei]|uniref:interleukin-1 receptor type 1-like isoform X2 n=1 Tax=Neoarius graeffei TaxID=443677 RepID=UPI00298C04DA|nr:interleukin-1 receptor type 1-like isoform X2 [Neoarius graeffei]